MITHQRPNTQQATHVDAAIIGGGIAGCWLLRLLSNRGYRVVLFEADQLGGDQTLASQGMIHGGLKYALGGTLTGASESIASMPGRWRRCLAGQDEVDLRGVAVLADSYHMFAQRSTLGRLTTFFASKALRGRVNKLNANEWPSAFNGFSGFVYALNDFVMDVPALLAHLTLGLETKTYRYQITPEQVLAIDDGYEINLPDLRFSARTLISCAGNGSNQLLKDLHIPGLKTQRRPLKQVIVRPRHGVTLNAHCVTGITNNEPRLTITSHGSGEDCVWYIGGLLATTGTARTDDEQIEFARKELKTCLPWLNWDGADFATLDVDRAEPFQEGGLKPDEAYVGQAGHFLQCFPTKLTLTPDLGDRVMELMPEPDTRVSSPLSSSSHPVPVGQLRW